MASKFCRRKPSIYSRFGGETLDPRKVDTISTFMGIHKRLSCFGLHEGARVLGAREVSCENGANLTEDVCNLQENPTLPQILQAVILISFVQSRHPNRNSVFRKYCHSEGSP